MKMKTLAAFLLPAALGFAALPAAALSVTSVSLAVSPATSHGPCPVKFTFTGKVTLNGKGTFRYEWLRSDGATDTTGPHTATYDGVHPAIVTTTWQLGAAIPLFHPFNGGQKLHILTPTDAVKDATFTLDCGGQPVGYPAPNTKCKGKPDLIPLMHHPMEGWVGVKNQGDGPAGPSVLILKCQKAGYPGPGGGGGCVDVPASLIAPPFFATPDGLGLKVPELWCGKEFIARMPWWSNMKWPKGTYNFTATADATNAVAESNEPNNIMTTTLVVP